MVPPRSSHSPTGSPPARRPPGAIPVARGVHDRGQHPADPRRPVDPGDGHRVARGGRGGDRGVRLTILGGRGFRVPLVYRALLADRGKDRVTEVVLHALDPGRIAVIRQVLAQQTAGAGGIAYGLRTVPVAVEIARRVTAVAPDAWVINFTNPAGLVTEAMSRHLGDRVIGICDSPAGMGRRVAAALRIDPAAAWFDYAGLNRLGWLRAVRVDGRDVLPGLLADDAALSSFEEGRQNKNNKQHTNNTEPNEY